MKDESGHADDTAVATPDRDPKPWACVLIFGYGKSGTKRLLRILDYSSRTHCRNEPYNAAGSPWQTLRTLPRGYFIRPEDEAVMQSGWDAAITWCSRRMGGRDRLPSPPKGHLSIVARRLGALHLLASSTGRRALGVLLPALRHDEWLLPRWAGNGAALARALTVLKINQSPGFATWVLQHRPRQRVLHIVRHPGAVLHSWTRRFLESRDEDPVRADNLARLRLIGNRQPDWAARFGDLDTMSVGELEMWFWLYATETTHEAGVGEDAYNLVLDEDVCRDPIRVARSVYQACGLEWETAVERALRRHADQWAACTCRWRELVDRDQAKMIDKLLGGSPLGQLWAANQVVSRIDYR